jgi:RecJ-like exonuclease
MKQMIDCPRCEGQGHIHEYAMIADGICFKCGGTGKVNAPVARKMSAKQEAAKAAREARIQAEAAEYRRVQNIAMNDPRVMASPRMRVTREHPYFYMHAMEVYQWHEKFGWDAR